MDKIVITLSVVCTALIGYHLKENGNPSIANLVLMAVLYLGTACWLLFKSMPGAKLDE